MLCIKASQPAVEYNEINYGESSLEAESSSGLKILASNSQTASFLLIDYKVEHSSISHPTMHHKLSSARRNRIEEFSAFCFIVSPQFTSFYYTIERSNLATSIKIERKRELFNSTAQRRKNPQWRPYKPIGDIKKVLFKEENLYRILEQFLLHTSNNQKTPNFMARVTKKN